MTTISELGSASSAALINSMSASALDSLAPLPQVATREPTIASLPAQDPASVTAEKATKVQSEVADKLAEEAEKLAAASANDAEDVSDEEEAGEAEKPAAPTPSLKERVIKQLEAIQLSSKTTCSNAVVSAKTTCTNAVKKFNELKISFQTTLTDKFGKTIGAIFWDVIWNIPTAVVTLAGFYVSIPVAALGAVLYAGGHAIKNMTVTDPAKATAYHLSEENYEIVHKVIGYSAVTTTVYCIAKYTLTNFVRFRTGALLSAALALYFFLASKKAEAIVAEKKDEVKKDEQPKVDAPVAVSAASNAAASVASSSSVSSASTTATSEAAAKAEASEKVASESVVTSSSSAASSTSTVSMAITKAILEETLEKAKSASVTGPVAKTIVSDADMAAATQQTSALVNSSGSSTSAKSAMSAQVAVHA